VKIDKIKINALWDKLNSKNKSVKNTETGKANSTNNKNFKVKKQEINFIYLSIYLFILFIHLFI